jgi:hypothetical protein
MAIYQKRPDTIDAVLISHPPQDPPFQPPVPDWLTEALAQGLVTYVSDTERTTVTLHYSAGGPSRGMAYSGDYVTRDVTTGGISTITQALLDQSYTRGPAEPTVQPAG